MILFAAGYACAAGSASATAVACAPGYYSDVGASECTACTAGYSCGATPSTITLCAAGTYALAASASCTNCTAGYACSAGSVNATSIPCPANYYAPSGSGTCQPCVPPAISGPKSAACYIPSDDGIDGPLAVGLGVGLALGLLFIGYIAWAANRYTTKRDKDAKTAYARDADIIAGAVLTEDAHVDVA